MTQDGQTIMESLNPVQRAGLVELALDTARRAEDCQNPQYCEYTRKRLPSELFETAEKLLEAAGVDWHGSFVLAALTPGVALSAAAVARLVCGFTLRDRVIIPAELRITPHPAVYPPEAERILTRLAHLGLASITNEEDGDGGLSGSFVPTAIGQEVRRNVLEYLKLRYGLRRAA